MLDQIAAALGFDPAKAGEPAQNGVAFTIAVVTLAAKMSKADGISSDVEVAAFEHLFDVPESERSALRRVFDLARQDVAGYESYARQIARMLAGDQALKVSVLESLLYMATADGVHHPAEETFLARVAEIIGIDEADYRAVRSAFVHDPDSPYDILGVAPNASDETIKARYRVLARELHPDLLTAKGVPPEFLCASSRRLAQVNDAYAAIEAERARRGKRRLEAAP